MAYVNKTTPSLVTASATLDTGLGIVDAPLVDSTATKLYAFSPQHGVYQLSTSFTSLVAPTATSVGTGSTTVPLYTGTFDNTYFNSSVFSGNIFLCGNPGGTSPSARVYQIPITTNTMSGTSTAGPIVSGTTTTTACSPATEVFNSPHDWVFLSAVNETTTSLPSGCTTAIGCVASYDVSSGAAVFSSAHAEAGGTSGISIDNVLSAANGDSQVYFSTQLSGTCATSALTGGCAVQAAQSGLGQ